MEEQNKETNDVNASNDKDKKSKAINSRKKIEKDTKKENNKISKSKKVNLEKKIKKENTKSESKEELESVREIVVERKAGFNYAEVIVIMIITLILGMVIGSFVTYVTEKQPLVGSTTTKVPNELEEFVNTYNNIISDFYEDVDHEGLLEAGINGMLDFLDDDYSVYMDKEASDAFNEQVEGKYNGIGVEIIQPVDGSVYIARVFSGSPAEKAGLKVGDIFLKVGDTDVTSATSSEISDSIKNSGLDKVSVVVERDGEEKTFTLEITQVDIESVTSSVLEKNGKKVGYLEISIFAANTYIQFEKKLLELEKESIDSLVIDVRDNSGGYLSTVTDIASLFLDKSKIIYQLDTKGVVEQIYSKTKTSRSYPISVLINQNSASASEILAGALQESYGASIIGVNSFGKGTVQKAYELESGATVKYTIQKWLTPDGNWVDEVGITPDVEVFMDGDYYQNPGNDTDNQLQTALDEVTK